VPDIIHLLPDSVANQIAAGEVIQRPASVVKELVENSLDAGASKITVQVKDAGRTLIQITDNGKGMSPADARMAFERHATSKINDAADLFAIRTMGFRGEALASVASVADVEVKTKREGEELGTFLHIAASEVKKQEVATCPEGTTISVKNLFFNVPARRKFLKSNSTELKHIITEIQRVALATPEVAFLLIHNGTPVYDLPAANSRKRIVAIFGNNMNQCLVPVKTETSLVKISGFIGQPKYARKSFGEQFFFVNGRYMRHPFFHKGVMQAYEKILPSNLIPAYFIFFEVDPAQIDINIHPTKTEIKFENESAIWQLLHAAVREGLGKFNVVPSIDFDQEGSVDIPVPPRSAEGLKRPDVEIDPSFNPFEKDTVSVPSKGFSSDSDKNNIDHWEKLYGGMGEYGESNFEIQQQSQFRQSSISEEGEGKPVEHTRNFVILKNKYILTPVKSGLMVIHQRGAHQRILFEQFVEMLQRHEGVCHQLLFPQTIETNPADTALLTEMLKELNALGFDIRPFGPDAFIINGVPGIIGETDAATVVEAFLEEYKTSAVPIKDQIYERVAASLAIASSIHSGHQLMPDEAGQLIDSLFACRTPNYSPTGKPVVEIIKIEEIEKKFRN
jgi:DNA mismatch repair protein MutL